MLNEFEKQRAAAYVSEKLSTRFIVTQGSLRTILGAYLDIDPRNVAFSFGPYRKPSLAENPHNLQFNLSHSGDFALVAISMGDHVGVDVEKVDPRVLEERLERSVLSLNELKIFYEKPCQERIEAFFCAWTHKEALLKLSGTGLFKDIKEVEVPLHTLPEPAEVPAGEARQYLRSFFLERDYLAALATTKIGFEITFRDYVFLHS